MKMAFQLIVKNTFLDIDDSYDEGEPNGRSSSKRCTSVPPMWKPMTPSHTYERRLPFMSTDSISTLASESDLDGSGSDRQDREVDSCCTSLQSSPAGAMQGDLQLVLLTKSLNPSAAEFRMPSSPEAMPLPEPMCSPCAVGAWGFPIVIAPQAVPYELGFSVLCEVGTVLCAAQGALLNSPHVAGVQVKEAPIGTATVVQIQLKDEEDTEAGRVVLDLAKAALLDAAAMSQNTYILGFAVEPFKDVDDKGFKTTVCSVPLQHQGAVCWDTYQQGSCSNRGSCHWQHPTDADMVPVHFTLK